MDADFDLLTHRKGRYPRIPRKRFQTCRARCDGRTISYVLADQAVRLLRGKLRLRQVTRLMDNGLQVTETELRVTLAPQSSPHRTRALAALCDQRSQTETLFPASRLRLHYAIREAS